MVLLVCLTQEKYSPDLASKFEFILFTKTDLISPSGLEYRKEEFIKETGISKKSVLSVSIYDDESLKQINDFLTAYLDKVNK